MVTIHDLFIRYGSELGNFVFAACYDCNSTKLIAHPPVDVDTVGGLEMAAKSKQQTQVDSLREVIRLLKLAIVNCQQALAEAERAVEDSRQANGQSTAH